MDHDILTLIVLKSDITTIIDLLVLNKEYNEFLKRNHIWKMLYERDFFDHIDSVIKHTFFNKYVSCHKIVLFSKKYNYDVTKIYNLQEIKLAYKTLEKFPTEIGQLQNLQELHFSNNQITTIPAEIGQLQNLQRLYLSNIQITMIPAEIGQLHNLQGLDLYNNQITTIPVEIGQLQNLIIHR